jgi:L-arabinonolactonase
MAEGANIMKIAEVPVTCVADTRDNLGEGCFWDVESQCLWWLDMIPPSRIHRLHVVSGELRTWYFTEILASLAMRRDKSLLVASARGLNVFNPLSGAMTPLLRLEADKPLNRGNDGACDALGRFWYGTMMNDIGEAGAELPVTEKTGTLYRIDSNLSATGMASGFGVSNGPCWSPDNRTFYFSDSLTQIIWAYDFDLAVGVISNPRVFNDSKDHGVPDGATVDAEGFLWSARWDGDCVLRIDPNGRIDRVVPMPARRVTNVCFGGPSLDTLYVTTSRIHMPEEDIRRHPFQGGLFCFDPGVKGSEKHRYGG